MKNGRMQAKDVPDRPVLEFIHRVRTEGVVPPATAVWGDERWHHVTWFEYDDQVPPNSVRLAMPAGTPDKVVLAKMRRLIDRGLVDGCPCGCRGDFELTEAGHAMIGVGSESPLTPAGPVWRIDDISADALWFSNYVEMLFRKWAPPLPPSPIAGTVGVVPVFLPELDAMLREAGVTVNIIYAEDNLEDARIALDLPAPGGDMPGPLAGRIFGDGGSFERPPWKAEREPPPPQSYLAHDPTKNVRRRRRK